MGQTPVKLRYCGRRRLGEERENVRFALGKLLLTQLVQIQADLMGRALNWMNKTKWHLVVGL